MGTALATPQQINSLRRVLESEKAQQQLVSAAGNELTAKRMTRLCLTACTKNPKLLDCTQQSIILSLLTASQLGLEVNGRDAHLVPFKDQCQLIPDYKGLVKLAVRSPRVKQFFAQVVYANDQFEVEYGTSPSIHHVPTTGERGPLIATYAVAKINTADPIFTVMYKQDIDKRKAVSKTANRPDGPWKLWPEEMWKKTVAKALCKWLPLGDRFESAVEHDNQVDTIDVDPIQTRTPEQLTADLTGDDRRTLDDSERDATEKDMADIADRLDLLSKEELEQFAKDCQPIVTVADCRKAHEWLQARGK